MSYCACMLLACATLVVVESLPQLPRQQQLLQPSARTLALPVVSQIDRRDEAGQFSMQYTTADGQVFTEVGVLKRLPDGSDNVLVKSGEYSYVSPEGVPIKIQYTADEDGFHPTGAALPVQDFAKSRH